MRVNSGTIAYRCVVLAWLLTMTGGVGYAGWNFWIDQRDIGRENTRLLKEQAGSLEKLGRQAADLDKLANKLDSAFDAIGRSSTIVVERLGQIQHEIDVIDGRVTALEKRRR